MDIDAAVQAIFHEAEQVAVSKVIDNTGNLAGYYLTADDWRRFRAHIVAEVQAAVRPPACCCDLTTARLLVCPAHPDALTAAEPPPERCPCSHDAGDHTPNGMCRICLWDHRRNMAAEPPPAGGEVGERE